MSYVVGLTGGIGSGKTLVSDRFAELSVPVIDTDVIARQVVRPGEAALGELVKEFGQHILLNDGQLNRDKLREIAFSNRENKQKLDNITHPAIRRETETQLKAVTYPYCLVVIPLLTAGSAFSPFLNRVLTVTCDQETRISRVMQRNQLSREAVERIIQTQLTDEERLAFADDVIDNSRAKSFALQATDEFHHKYLDLSQALTRDHR